MPYPTPAAIALAIAVLFKRSGKSRARISEKSFRLISHRPRQLRESLIANFRAEIEELDVVAIPLDRGGFGLIAASALEGAAPIKAADFLTSELPSIKKGVIDEAQLWSELDAEDDREIDSDD